MEEAEHLPFAPQEVLYTAFDSGLAQVEYRGENGQTALLRKSQGTEDNSGDFDQYQMCIRDRGKGPGGKANLRTFLDGLLVLTDED